MNYYPRDIRSPKDFSGSGKNEVVYLKTFGKAEYEIVAQRLVEESQKEDKWISLEVNDFNDLFKEYVVPKGVIPARGVILDMTKKGYLKEENGRYSLSEKSIEKIVSMYPAEKH